MMKVRNLGFGCNDYLLGFISIKVAKFLHWLAAPNTTLLLYQGLGPAMLGHQRRPTIGGVWLQRLYQCKLFYFKYVHKLSLRKHIELYSLQASINSIK